MSRPARDGESAGYEEWLQGRSRSLNMSVIDLEYAIATMASALGEALGIPNDFMDEPETWSDVFSEAFRAKPKWFEWAITQYLKGR